MGRTGKRAGESADKREGGNCKKGQTGHPEKHADEDEVTQTIPVTQTSRVTPTLVD